MIRWTQFFRHVFWERDLKEWLDTHTRVQIESTLNRARWKLTSFLFHKRAGEKLDHRRLSLDMFSLHSRASNIDVAEVDVKLIFCFFLLVIRLSRWSTDTEGEKGKVLVNNSETEEIYFLIGLVLTDTWSSHTIMNKNAWQWRRRQDSFLCFSSLLFTRYESTTQSHFCLTYLSQANTK